MITIYDIAKAADTSPASVSRVINGRQGVRADVARRIKAVMESMNFQPRWKALDRDRIMVLIPGYKHTFDGSWVAQIMSGITDAAFAVGYGLQLRPLSTSGKDIGDLRQLYMQEAVSGCIVIPFYQGYSMISQLDLAGLPHVVVGHKMEDDDIHQVLLDDLEAGRNAAEFLLSLGHERIAMVSFSHLERGHLDRYRGFAEAMKSAGKVAPVCVQCNEATYEAGKSAARRLLSPLERPTAVIVTNEDIAVGFHSEVRAMNFSIPKDLSLIAFEETDKLSLLETPITAMQTPAYNMGMESVKMLRSMIAPTDKKGAQPQSEYLTNHLSIPLVARQSTARLQ